MAEPQRKAAALDASPADRHAAANEAFFAALSGGAQPAAALPASASGLRATAEVFIPLSSAAPPERPSSARPRLAAAEDGAGPDGPQAPHPRAPWKARRYSSNRVLA
jgi:hypothetical protein